MMEFSELSIQNRQKFDWYWDIGLLDTLSIVLYKVDDIPPYYRKLVINCDKNK